MVKTWAAKDPDEVLDYSYDWAEDLQEGETLLPAPDSVFEVVTASGTALQGAAQYGPDFVTVVITGGNAGTEAIFTSRVKTTADRILEDTIILPVRSTIVPVAHPGGYVDPTPANLLCFFPEFATVSEPVLQSYLNRAATSVDNSWSEGDFAYARILLAAHMLTLNGQGTGAEASAVRDGSGEFKSMAIGPLKLERFDKAKAALAGSWAATRYGREFAGLLRRNKGGPRVAGYSSAADRSYGDNFGPWTG